MTSISAEERTAMREGFRRLLREKGSEANLRCAMASESGHDADLWRGMAEMGVTALIVPTEYDGVGAGPIEVEAIMEEAGAALLKRIYAAAECFAVQLGCLSLLR